MAHLEQRAKQFGRGIAFIVRQLDKFTLLVDALKPVAVGLLRMAEHRSVCSRYASWKS